MSLQRSASNAVKQNGATPAATSFLRRHSLAQSKLNRALQDQRPVAVMIGADSFELGRVTGEFVRSLDERTTGIRLRQPQANALAAFAEINRAIGFDPKDLTLSDLQNVLTLFLEHQCNHRHRTVLCIEKADEQSMWLLDCMARLIKSTGSSEAGRSLLIVLSGSNRLTDLLRNTAFDAIREKAGLPIRLPPFSIFETREFLRQLCNSAGIGDVQSMFEFDAVDRLQSVSGGRCATPKVVVQAARNLRAADSLGTTSASARPTAVRGSAETVRRLLIRCPDRPVQEFSLKAGRFMVGRMSTADIHLPSPAVSRRHALIIDSGEAIQVLDLDSTNGTFVQSERISEVTLKPGSVLTIGDCEIEYAVD